MAKPDALRVMDGTNGREITRLPLGRWLAERHGAPYWTLHRADLHAALMRRVREAPLVRLTMGTEATGIDEIWAGTHAHRGERRNLAGRCADRGGRALVDTANGH